MKLVIGISAVLVALVSTVIAGQTIRVSVDPNGGQANDHSSLCAVSGDGSSVAFSSLASNLVAADTNGCYDVFVRDMNTGQTTRVSVDASGVQANNQSGGDRIGIDISLDGRCVAFASFASNLVPGDTNFEPDIFLHDRVTGETIRVNVRSDGSQATSGWSESPCVSADGQLIVFASWAPDLVANDTNGTEDVFVHDRRTGETTRVSVDSQGRQGSGAAYPTSISPDGRFIGFTSEAPDLVANDMNGQEDAFVHDRATGETVRVSVASDGTEGNFESRDPELSADGRHVVFESSSSNLVPDDHDFAPQVFLHDRVTGETTMVSRSSWGDVPNGQTANVGISADGRFVTFCSIATNLVPRKRSGWYDIFVTDRTTGQTTCVSVNDDGSPGDGNCDEPAIAADGRHVVFMSDATTFAHDDPQWTRDIFRHDIAALTFVGTPSYPNPVHYELTLGEPDHLVMVFLSASGTSGFSLYGQFVPLTVDAMTLTGLRLLPLLSAVCDATGSARTPDLTMPPAPPGLVIWAAAITLNPPTGHLTSMTPPTAFVTQ